MSGTQPVKTPLQVGVLLCGEVVQLLDVSPVDVLGMLQPYYIRACELPQPLVDMGIEMEFHFITETGEGPQQLTGGMKCVVTVRHSTQTIPRHHPPVPLTSVAASTTPSVNAATPTGLHLQLPNPLHPPHRRAAPQLRTLRSHPILRAKASRLRLHPPNHLHRHPRRPPQQCSGLQTRHRSQTYAAQAATAAPADALGREEVGARWGFVEQWGRDQRAGFDGGVYEGAVAGEERVGRVYARDCGCGRAGPGR